MNKKICLNMIVKNESKVIKRCLASVKQIIDYWVIADTGSTDGTQEIIREFMKDIPGELIERPWVDFSHNRNEVLSLSKEKADFLLFIDADEQFVFSDTFTIPKLDLDSYFILIHQLDGINYFRESLIRSSLNWKWVGPVHEALISSEAKTKDVLKGITNLSITEDGHRYQDPKKYLKDAAILEEALKSEPKNSRYAFYLALSYGNAHEYQEALKWHKKRIAMGGLEEEIFYSLLSIGKIEENLNVSPDKFIKSYVAAHLYRPSRAEPLYFIANYYIRTENHFLAYLFSKAGLTIASPTDTIFVQHSIYDTGLLLQFADSSYLVGKKNESLEAYKKLLTKEGLPEATISLIKKNLSLLKKI